MMTRLKYRSPDEVGATGRSPLRRNPFFLWPRFPGLRPQGASSGLGPTLCVTSSVTKDLVKNDLPKEVRLIPKLRLSSLYTSLGK